MTSASFAISQLDLKISTMHLHSMTLMWKFIDVQLSWKILPSIILGTWLLLRSYIIENALQISTTGEGPWKTVFNKSCDAVDAHLHGIAFAELVGFMWDLQNETLHQHLYSNLLILHLCTRLDLSSLVLMLKAGCTRQSSKKDYYQYFQIFKHVDKANVLFWHLIKIYVDSM